MISREELEKILRRIIESEEKLGTQSGGSGHLGYVDYMLEEFGDPVLTGDQYSVTYKYTLIVTTEFTYEPDNPPYRTPVTKTALIRKEVIEGTS